MAQILVLHEYLLANLKVIGHRLYIPVGYYNLMDHDRPRHEGWDPADVVLLFP